MLYLEAFVNVMPYNIYTSLNLVPSKETSIIIWFFDRTNFFPNSVIEDVWVEVDEIYFQ